MLHSYTPYSYSPFAACPANPSDVWLHDKRTCFPRLCHLPISARGHRRAFVSCSAVPAESTKVEDVLLVGGGIAGMATALGLHKLGLKSRVLEQSPTLRVTGAALAVWTNGWHALEALGVADDLRDKFVQLSGFQFYSSDNNCLSNLDFASAGKHVELRGVDRRLLLETLTNALPPGIISYNSCVTKLFKDEGNFSQIELKDGSIIRAKVVVGCDGIGSVVARNLGLGEAHYAGYTGIRGVATFPEKHTFPSALRQFMDRGVRVGCLPLDYHRVYWFLVFNHPEERKIMDPNLVKQEALRLVQGLPEAVLDVVRKTPIDTLSRSAISDRWMWPWSVPKLHQCGVTVAGDAMHPVTPNLAQGGCTALENGVVLARVLSNLFKLTAGQNFPIKEEMEKIELALDEYTKPRQQRMFGVAVQANFIGKVLQAEGDLICSVRDALLPRVLTVDSFISHSLYDVGVLA